MGNFGMKEDIQVDGQMTLFDEQETEIDPMAPDYVQNAWRRQSRT